MSERGTSVPARWRAWLQGAIAAAVIVLLAGLEAAAVGTVFSDRILASAAAGNASAQTYLMAARWRPDIAETWRLAADAGSFLQPAQAQSWALHALTLEPTSWRAWQTLAMIQLQMDETSAAMASMRQAARFGHGFEAHYALGNLALVLGDLPTFWAQTRAALAIAPAAQVGMVLTRAARQDAGDAGALLALLPPGRPEVSLQAVQFFLDHHQLPSAVQAWRPVTCAGAAIRLPCRVALENLIDQLVASAYQQPGVQARPTMATAMTVWNRAVAAGMIQQSRLTAGQLNGGDFDQPWFSYLSWQSTSRMPTAVVPEPGAGQALDLAFSGDEEEHLPIAFRYLPVQPGQAYRLVYRSRGVASSPLAGIQVSVRTPAGELASDAAQMDEQWRDNGMTWTVPSGVAVVYLQIVYQRPVGQVRLRGHVYLTQFQLQPE